MAAKKSTAHRSKHQRLDPIKIHHLEREQGEKDPDEKEAMVEQLADTALATAMLLEAGVEVYDAYTWRSLAFGLCTVLRAAADPVRLYVLEQPSILASRATAPKHLLHALKKTLSRLTV